MKGFGDLMFVRNRHAYRLVASNYSKRKTVTQGRETVQQNLWFHVFRYSSPPKSRVTLYFLAKIAGENGGRFRSTVEYRLYRI